ncbi:hypothetical protein [Peribacillus sp. SCS-37]|uniref:hypothetical protein n=1 Tax=Paraperibacillus esterisolvens TaxID=3115296 RepID=UPI0039062847
MKKSTMNLMLGSLISAGGAAFFVAAYKQRQKESFKVLEDTDMRKSEKIDQMESVYAPQDPEEQGLSQLDSAYRAEWVANGFPQTHRELEELEKEEEEESYKK